MIRLQGLILVFLCQLTYASEVPHIKVRIGQSLKKVNVSGFDLQRNLWPKKEERYFAGSKTIEFNCHSNQRKKGIQKPIRLATIKSLTGLLNWDKERFKGEVHIQTSERFNGCDIINELTLEDYLTTLLPKEMSSSWPIEALKAQAVAARTYAYFKIKTKQVSKTAGFDTNYDLESSEKHQVNGSYFDATESTITATRETKGVVLMNIKNKVSPAFYHSKCGGKTLRPDQVWSNPILGYSSVTCPFCHKHGTKDWKRVIPKQKWNSYVQDLLTKMENTSKNEYMYLKDTKLNSQIKLYVDSEFKVLKKSKLRANLGRKTLPSNLFNLKEDKNSIIIDGAGYGHGVGMCQFGAKEMALQGLNYKQILAHYFPGLKLKKIY